jgi:hypothetical protein
MGVFSWLLEKKAETSAPPKELSLPPPPAGFSWHYFPEARVTALRPDGWHVHQVAAERSFTGCISKESVKEGGSFETGLTVQVLSGVQEALGMPASVAALGMYQTARENPFNQVLCADAEPRQGPHAFSFRFRYRNAPEVAKPIIVHCFYLAFDEISQLNLFTFESPESVWEESWQTGEQMLRNLVVTVDT